MPNKLKQRIVNGVERPQTLPPCAPRKAYPVDSFPACPDSWMNGSDIAGSYFVGVEEDKGMWLDFNCCNNLEREVAVVISIQGVNPITGQKTDALRLEQYKEKCPIHDVPFQQDNYCPKCDFDWPDQNYLATTGTPFGNFWLDGFRRPDGTVRQYIFTEEEMKGIASQIIGKDKVYAIGIAFYYSKEKKTQQPTIDARRWDDNSSVIHHHYHYETPLYKSTIGYQVDDGDWYAGDTVCCDGLESLSSTCSTDGPSASLNNAKGRIKTQTAGKDVMRGMKETPVELSGTMRKKSVTTVKPVKKLEIGAGALINQKVYRDTKGIDYWEDEPAGMLYVNYCDMDTMNRILDAGEIKKKSEGFMDGLAVGG
jgi:hypothetical protein